MQKKLLYLALAALLALTVTACGEAANPPAADTTVPTEPAPVTTEAPKPTTLTLGSNYTIIRDEDGGQLAISAATALRNALGGAPGIETDWIKKGTEATFGEYEILLGATNRPESIALSEGLGRYDYRIKVEGEKLVIAGGSDVALATAVAELTRSGALTAADEGITLSRDYTLSFDGAKTREDYIADPYLFLVDWILEFDVPEWMTDYEEKQAAWADADGRMMTAIHRNDHTYYPENSIEGIISCIQMGVDSLEIDVGKTKDGVLVLMHDATLKRTTDWEQKQGKNGLPTSNNLADWTLAELRQLCLKTNSGVQTDYLIPTLEEVLLVCKGHIWARLDKLTVFDWDSEITPLIEKTEAYEVLIFNRQYAMAKIRAYRDFVESKGGTPLYYYSFSGNDWAALLTMLEKYDLHPIGWWTGYDKKNHASTLKSGQKLLNSVYGKARVYVDAQSLGGATESPEIWDELYAAGVNFILCDDVMQLQKYIAENYEPTAK